MCYFVSAYDTHDLYYDATSQMFTSASYCENLGLKCITPITGIWSEIQIPCFHSNLTGHFNQQCHTIPVPNTSSLHNSTTQLSQYSGAYFIELSITQQKTDSQNSGVQFQVNCS